MKNKKCVLVLVTILMMLSICTLLFGCRPGYREVWTPVEVPTFAWEDNGDIKTIQSRIASEILNKDIDVDAIWEIADGSNGTFKGYDYDYPDRTEQWWPLEHLRATEKLYIAYNSEGHKYYHNEDIKNFVVKAIAFWVDRDFYCKWSGWNNTIGLGLTVPNILLLDDGSIKAEDKQGLLDRIKSTLLQNGKLRFPVKERTVNEGGGNLTDQIVATMKVACLENDGNIMMWLKSLLENELRPFPPYKGPNYHRWDAEGPKEDYSFQQHDQLVYFGGYGEVFLSGVNRYLRFTENTQYQLGDKALNFYARFVLNGMQYAFRDEYRDISSAGRGISRTGGLKGIYKPVKDAVNELLEYRDKTSAKLDDDVISGLNYVLENRIKPIENGEKDKGAGGHRYFYESDYGIHNTSKYMATVRHASNRSRIFECLNNENIYGYYGGLGATFYYVDGDEYYNLMPMYDWNKVPGTTSLQGYIPKLGDDASYNRYGANKYAMGVSDGKIGMSYFRQHDHSVKARKAYFMFEDGVVCLGSDISSTLPSKVVTSVNQTRWDGDVVVSQNGVETTLNSATSMSGTMDYIYHDRIGYIVDNAVNIALDKDREGDWHKIRPAGKTDVIKADIFSIDIDHGAFNRGNSYAYTVLMNTTRDATKAYAAAPTLKVLANDKHVQAVMDMKNNVVEAVFHESAKLTIGDNILRLSEGACLILDLSGDTPILTIASNDAEEHDIKIEYAGKSLNKKIDRRPMKIIY